MRIQYFPAKFISILAFFLEKQTDKIITQKVIVLNKVVVKPSADILRPVNVRQFLTCFFALLSAVLWYRVESNSFRDSIYLELFSNLDFHSVTGTKRIKNNTFTLCTISNKNLSNEAVLTLVEANEVVHQHLVKIELAFVINDVSNVGSVPGDFQQLQIEVSWFMIVDRSFGGLFFFSL